MSTRLKGIRSLVAVPLMLDAQVIGALYMDQDDPRRAFKARHQERLRLLTNLVAAKLAKAQVSTEMQTAATIARCFLAPAQSPAGFEAAARLETCAKVGGDLYETLLLPDGRYVCAVGDVAGKGMSAALVMAETLAMLRALAVGTGSPLQLVRRMRQLLSGRLAHHMFVTLFLAYLEPRSGRLDYVSAGHEPAVVLPPGEGLRWLESRGPPIGMDIPGEAGRSSNGHVDTVPPGDVTLWQTDPLTPTEKDGRIYGRGAEDAKGCLAAMIIAFEALAARRKELPVRIILMAVGAEERGGLGTKAEVANGIRADAAIVGESTPLEPKLAHNGVLRLEVEGQG